MHTIKPRLTPLMITKKMHNDKQMNLQNENNSLNVLRRHFDNLLALSMCNLKMLTIIEIIMQIRRIVILQTLQQHTIRLVQM